MFYMDELKDLWIHKKKVHLPVHYRNKRRNSVVFLLTPSIESSIKLINHPLLINKYHIGYYLEKDVMFYINNEGSVVDNELTPVLENVNQTIDENMIKNNDYTMNKQSLIFNNNHRTQLLLFNDLLEDEPIEEGSIKHNFIIRKLLYEERFRRNKEIFDIYNRIRKECPAIYRTYLTYERHKQFNIFVDFYYYNAVYFKNSMYKLNRGIDLYLDLMTRYLNDKRLDANNYNKKYVFIPVDDWNALVDKPRMELYTKTINPISIMYRLMQTNMDRLQSELGMMPFVFFGKEGYFKINFAEFKRRDMARFLKFINILKINDLDKEEEEINKTEKPKIIQVSKKIIKAPLTFIRPVKKHLPPKISKVSKGQESVKSIVTNVVDMIEKKTNVKIDNLEPKPKNIYKVKKLTGDIKNITKKEIDDKIDKAVVTSTKPKPVVAKPTPKYIPSKPKAPATKIIPPTVKSKPKDIKITTTLTKPKSTPTKSKTISKDTSKSLANEKKKIKELENLNNKEKLINKITKAAIDSKNTDATLDKLDNDVEFKKMLLDLSHEESNRISVARSKRINQLKEDYKNIKVQDKTVKEILDEGQKQIELPKTDLKIDTINDEWSELQAINFEEMYDIEEDLLKIIDDLSSENKEFPILVRDIKKEDTSTSEDYKYTYTFDMEDAEGTRFKLNLDIPELYDNKFLMLKGNKKALTRQLMLLPIIKTSPDTVQIVTDYKKIIINRFGNKSFITSDRIIKALSKYTGSSIKIVVGDCTRSNTYYELPIDYVEISANYVSIENKNYKFLFNQNAIKEEYESIYKEYDNKFPVAYDKINKKLVYCNHNDIYSVKIKELLIDKDSTLLNLYNNTNISRKYTYSRASILNNNIPLILVLAYSEGLLNIMNKAKIKYTVYDKRPKYNKDNQDIIRFKDAYIVYDITYESSLLLNGMKECDTRLYSIVQVNNKSMYLDFLDGFGGRIIADGLENFYELMIDPIAKEILDQYNLPNTYTEVLLYANNMLADTKYTQHVDMSGVRYRSNEIINACAYRVISTAYGNYKNELKRGRRKVKLNIKQSAVIDELLKLNIISDVSELSPVLEAETLNTVSTKGPSGMNEERAYTLDKRAYHPSMLNVLGMSTPQGAGVGINRQTTIDANIEGKRGFIKIDTDPKNFNITKTLTVSEALSPFGVTRDDPPRTSMNLSQTKHTMQVVESDPLLISNGIEEALPYMISNTFAHKAKGKGIIEEVNDDYAIVKYDDDTSDFVDLRPKVLKNSGGGFYITTKLDTDLKKGNKIKEKDIIAYDKQSFSKSTGISNNIAYNSGTFTKIAILNTDDGFEDSAIISEKLSEKMASDVVMKTDVYLGKNSNLYKMVKVGDYVQEGDPLLIYQESYDEEDINALLRTLVDDIDAISELGRDDIKSKYTGSIQDIKIYRTVEKNELSPSLRRKVNEIERNTRNLKTVMKRYDVQYANRFDEPDYKLDPTGKLKKVREGVLIEFYIKYRDKMAVGDKLTFFIALKGIIKDIFPKDDEPYTDFRPKEKINALLSVGSINSRMTCSIIINMLINKIMIELVRSVREILGIKNKFDEF